MWTLGAMVIGFALDLLIGDPQGWPHPVAALGRLIAALERGLRRLFPATPRGERAAGGVLWLLTVLTATAVPALVLWLCRRVSPWLGLGAESVMCWQILAVRVLRVESMKVYHALASGDVEAARRAVSMIVGRDTQRLDRAGICRAAVETVAENSSDGVVAPLVFLALGGAPLGFFYKAVNTMDSMLGSESPSYSCGGCPAGDGCKGRLAHLLPGPVPPRQPQLRPDRVHVRGPAGPAAGGGRLVPRRAPPKAHHRRPRPGGGERRHSQGLPPAVRDVGAGAGAVRPG